MKKLDKMKRELKKKKNKIHHHLAIDYKILIANSFIKRNLKYLYLYNFLLNKKLIFE